MAAGNGAPSTSPRGNTRITPSTQRAGSGSHTPIIELHGNITRTKCFEENIPIGSWDDIENNPPHCPRCGGLLRPDVVWFGEALPADALQAAWQATQTSQLFLSIGTSTVIEPAASLPFTALDTGATVVEINPADTPLTPSAHFVINGPAGEILPALLAVI